MSVIRQSAQAQHFDDDLLQLDRACEGDAEAFQRLYERYYPKVYALARGVLLNSDDAADAVQEIFTQVYRNMRRFNRRSLFSTWLFRIAVNRSIQLARSNKRRRGDVELTDQHDRIAPSDEESPIDPNIETAMSQLDAPDRAILTLFYWDELTLQEIGESMECGANAAKTRLWRARERFRTAYGGKEE